MTNQQIRNASVPILCDRLTRLIGVTQSHDKLKAYERKLIETELLYRPIEDEFPDALRDDTVYGGLGDFLDETLFADESDNPSEYERLVV